MEDRFQENGFQNNSCLKYLDTRPEKEYDDITKLTSLICNTPISLISVLTDTKQIFKSYLGLSISETPIEESFCAYAVQNPQEIFIVEDARKDERFKNNSFVTGQPNIIFYAGMPLVDKKGNAVGTLCIMDTKPRKLDNNQFLVLKSLADKVVLLFELRKNAIKIKNLVDNHDVESQHLKNVIKATQVGTWEWDILTGRVTINERWAEMLGFTLEELEPLDFEGVQRLIYAKDVESLNKMVTACLSRKTDFYVGNFRFLHKNGHIVWVHDRGQIIKWSENGQPLLMVGTHTDFTEHKTTETQLKTIADNIPGAVFRYKLNKDGSDELQLVSKGAKNLWGFSSEEVINNNLLIWERFEDEDMESHLQSIQRSMENLSFWQHEWRYHHPDGITRWHKGSGNPIRLKDGSTIWDSVVFDITLQKNNELAIEQSEKRFKGLVQNGSDLIAILDFEGNYLYVSPTSFNILGIYPEDCIGKNAFQFIHPDDKEEAFSNLSRLETEKQVSTKPYRFRHTDGTWRWVETIITNLLENPAVGGIVANSRDITERILTEEKLRKSQDYYQVLYRSQTNYVVRTDMHGNYIYINEKFIKDFGWLHSDGIIIGKNCLNSIVDYHHQKTHDVVGQCVNEPNKVFKVEIDKPTKTGGIVTTLWDFVCFLDADGNPSEIQCIGLDITSRVKSQKALKESEQRYSDLFHLSPQPMWVYDLKSLKFLDVNDAAIKHYGYSFEEFLQMTLREIRPKSEISKLNDTSYVKQIKGESYYHGEYIHKRKNGEEIIVEVRTNVVLFKGKLAKVALVSDITERYKHLKAIEEQNSKLKKIAWTQSHEVRAPLSRIMGLVELLNNEELLNGDGDKVLKYLKFSSEELDGILRKIIDTIYEEGLE